MKSKVLGNSKTQVRQIFEHILLKPTHACQFYRQYQIQGIVKQPGWTWLKK